MNKIIATVKICGREYTITGPESTEHMRKVAELVDRKMREIQKDHFGMVPNLLALMTAINIADEYIKLKEAAKQVEAAKPDYKKSIPLSDYRNEADTIQPPNGLQNMPAPGIQKLPRIGQDSEEPIQRKTTKYTLFPKQSDISNESVAAAAGIARMAARAAEEAPLEDEELMEQEVLQSEQPIQAEKVPESFFSRGSIMEDKQEDEPFTEANDKGRPENDAVADEEAERNEYLDQTIFDGF